MRIWSIKIFMGFLLLSIRYFFVIIESLIFFFEKKISAHTGVWTHFKCMLKHCKFFMSIMSFSLKNYSKKFLLNKSKNKFFYKRTNLATNLLKTQWKTQTKQSRNGFCAKLNFSPLRKWIEIHCLYKNKEGIIKGRWNRMLL